MKQSNVSKCCGSSVSVAGSDEGTMFFVCDACHKSCDVLLPGEKPKSGKDFFYGKVKPATDTLEGEYLKELGWDTPEYGWTHERKILNKLIKLAEQRGYERGKSEA